MITYDICDTIMIWCQQICSSINCIRLLIAFLRMYKSRTVENAILMRHAAQRSGAIGIKLLQLIIMRDNIFTPEYKQHFEGMLEDCDRHSWDETARMYKEDFKHDIDADYILYSFDEDMFTSYIPVVPIGSGSIGQVYKLYSKTHKTYVALKVKHPSADVIVHNFVATFNILLRIAGWFNDIPFKTIIQEFIDNVILQLDYVNEAHNTSKLRHNFQHERHIVIPEILDVSDRFIVMTYHDGAAFHSIEDSRLKRKISMDLNLFMAISFIDHDLLHCDLHDGNWKVQLDNENMDDYKIVIYDCGIMGYTGNTDFNKKIMNTFYDGDYVKLIDVILSYNHDLSCSSKSSRYKLLQEKIAEIMRDEESNMTERLSDIITKTLELGFAVESNIARCILSFNIFGKTLSVSADHVNKIIGDAKSKKSIIIHFYHYVMRRSNKYAPLLQYFNDCLQNDPSLQSTFHDWLNEEFGHTDEDVFFEVTANALGF